MNTINNPYTYIVISFIIFLAIGYIKLWPIINLYMMDYQEQVIHEINVLANKRGELQSKLDNLYNREEAFQFQLNQMRLKAKKDEQILGNTYTQSIKALRAEKYAMLEKNCQRLASKFEGITKTHIAKTLSCDLTEYFKTSSKKQNFNSHSIEKAVEFVKNRIL